MAQNDPNGNRQDEQIVEDEQTRESRRGSDRPGEQQSEGSSSRPGVGSDADDSEDLDDMDEDRDDDQRTSGEDRRGR